MEDTELSNGSLDATRVLALSAHGEDYYGHLERVACYFMELVRLLPPGILSEPEVQSGMKVCYLHDIIEDGYLTAEDLARLGYSDVEISMILALTRDPATEVYADKIKKIANGGVLLVILVKLVDNRDNSTPGRIADLPPERRSIVKRYRKARRVLFNGLADHLRRPGVSEDVIDRIELWLGSEDTAPW